VFHTAISSAQTITETFGTGANAFSMDFVTIGNPGNSADTTGNPNPVGSVSYIYNMAKYEVSREMIEKANSQGGLNISLQDMSSNGGNGLLKPATGISWNEAARFVNWLNTSKGYQAAYNFASSGSNDNISLWGSGQSSGSNLFRHKNAFYFLPSDDEWYKAAYGSPVGTWYNFPTGSDSVPTPVAGGTSPGTAVYLQPFNQGPADITNAGGLSLYGTMAQGGNVWELIESAADLTNDDGSERRALRGSPWEHVDDGYLHPTTRFTPQATDEYLNTGFRVASVPEPSALSLLAVGLGGLAVMRRRRS